MEYTTDYQANIYTVTTIRCYSPTVMLLNDRTYSSIIKLYISAVKAIYTLLALYCTLPALYMALSSIYATYMLYTYMLLNCYIIYLIYVQLKTLYYYPTLLE